MTANPYALAAELARPVARGHLSWGAAHAALAIAAVDAERAGSPYAPHDVYGGLRHILGLHVARERMRRAIAEMRIKRRLKPLIALRKPRNVLLAEAHDVNGGDGFPLDEPSVTDITMREVYFAGRPRHG